MWAQVRCQPGGGSGEAGTEGVWVLWVRRTPASWRSRDREVTTTDLSTGRAPGGRTHNRPWSLRLSKTWEVPLLGRLGHKAKTQPQARQTQSLGKRLARAPIHFFFSSNNYLLSPYKMPGIVPGVGDIGNKIDQNPWLCGVYILVEEEGR